MKTTRCKTAIMVVLSVLVAGGILLAGPGGPRHHRRGGPGVGSGVPPMQLGRNPMLGRHGRPVWGMAIVRGLRWLNLTEEQREQIRAILEEAEDVSEANREIVADATEALHTAVIEGSDEKAIREAATNLGNALGDQAVQRASIIASIKEVLTDEQLEQLQEMKDQELHEGLGRPRTWGGAFHRGCGPGAPGIGFGRPGKGCNIGPGAGLRIDWLIEKIDTDGDGTLTAEEIEAFKEKVEDRPN
jgi:Spy/CpxP family protein refolding chaperone